jgi:tyrosinase
MYLYYFERILRAAGGDPNLALPYWNYSNTANPDARRLPLPFRVPATAANPLFVSARSPAINGGGLMAASAVNFATAFMFTNFDSPTSGALSFGGRRVTAPMHAGSGGGSLENTPHGAVHVQVGGSGGWMSSFEFAARDPIFWLHHANIDRLWRRWLDQGGGRANPTDAVWRTQLFTFFNEFGQAVTLSGQQVVDTARQLNYRYDEDPPIPFAGPVEALVPVEGEVEPEAEPGVEPMERAVLGVSESLTLEAEPVAVDIAVKDTATLVGQALGTLVLNVEGMEMDRNPGAHYEIYLNLPAGQAPDYQSRYYVGNLTFFGLGAGAHHPGGEVEEAASQSFSLEAVEKRLRESGEWKEGVYSVTFVRRGPEPPPGAPQAVEAEPAVQVKIRRVTVTRE